MSKETTMAERFDELRKQVAGHYDMSLPPEVLSFISQERKLAVEEERKKFVDMIRQEDEITNRGENDNPIAEWYLKGRKRVTDSLLGQITRQ